MKVSMKVLLCGLAAGLLAVSVVMNVFQGRSRVALEGRVRRQEAVIDTLIQWKRPLMEVELNVTDKSVNRVYGRYNKGVIEIPSTKIYKLEVDSTLLISTR